MLATTARTAHEARRISVLVTTSDARTLGAMADECVDLASTGADVRVLFRDESIPSVCKEAVRRRLVPADVATSMPSAGEALETEKLSQAGIKLYVCTSSMYLWGVTADDLAPGITGPRGLIAFLADDLAGAARVLTY